MALRTSDGMPTGDALVQTGANALPLMTRTWMDYFRNKFTALAGSAAKPGDYMVTARQDVPDNYLPADGRAVLRVSYPDLYGALGTRYGAGDGTTTFNIPDVVGDSARRWLIRVLP